MNRIAWHHHNVDAWTTNARSAVRAGTEHAALCHSSSSKTSLPTLSCRPPVQCPSSSCPRSVPLLCVLSSVAPPSLDMLNCSGQCPCASFPHTSKPSRPVVHVTVLMHLNGCGSAPGPRLAAHALPGPVPRSRITQEPTAIQGRTFPAPAHGPGPQTPTVRKDLSMAPKMCAATFDDTCDRGSICSNLQHVRLHTKAKRDQPPSPAPARRDAQRRVGECAHPDTPTEWNKSRRSRQRLRISYAREPAMRHPYLSQGRERAGAH